MWWVLLVICVLGLGFVFWKISATSKLEAPTMNNATSTGTNLPDTGKPEPVLIPPGFDKA